MTGPQTTSMHGEVQRAEEGCGQAALSDRIGALAGGLLTVAAAAAWVMAVVIPGAPARSGPNCKYFDIPCFSYPYTGGVEYVPGDFLWMVPAFTMGPLVVVLIVALLARASDDRRPVGQVALVLAGIAAALLTAAYYLQFTTVQTALTKGELDAGLSLLSQYNPHGVFIALEDLGYLMLLACFGTAAAIVGRSTRAQRLLRRTMAASGAIGVAGIPIVVALLGPDQDYYYELLALAVSWIALLVIGPLAALVFTRQGR